MPFGVKIPCNTKPPLLPQLMDMEQGSQVTWPGSNSPQPTRVCTPLPKISPPQHTHTRPTCSPRQRWASHLINKVCGCLGWDMFITQNICLVIENTPQKQVSESTQPQRRACIDCPNYRMLSCIMENQIISSNAFIYSTMISPLHLGSKYLIARPLNFLTQGG